MNNSLILLAEIIKNPEDDTLRLAYADCIEEEIDKKSRAEFIRVQIEYHRLSNAEPNSLYIEDWDRMNYLKVRISEMTRNLKSGIFPVDAKWLSRGFIEMIECTAEQLLSLIGKLIWHPDMVRKCYFCDGTGVELGASPDRGNQECGKCQKGQVPEPCPSTAHPIQHVTILNPFPEGYPMNFYKKAGPGKWSEKPWYCRQIPGVRFTLPALYNAVGGFIHEESTDAIEMS